MRLAAMRRTAAENGSRGTDHGVGGLAMLAGGAVAGGRIAGAWPGLAEKALYEGRDLRPVNAYEGIFKVLMIGHLGLKPGFIEAKVFPDSRDVSAMEGLLGVMSQKQHPAFSVGPARRFQSNSRPGR